MFSEVSLTFHSFVCFFPPRFAWYWPVIISQSCWCKTAGGSSCSGWCRCRSGGAPWQLEAAVETWHWKLAFFFLFFSCGEWPNAVEWDHCEDESVPVCMGNNSKKFTRTDQKQIYTWEKVTMRKGRKIWKRKKQMVAKEQKDKKKVGGGGRVLTSD